MELWQKPVGIFGKQWRGYLFGEVENLVLLMALEHLDSAVAKLFNLLCRVDSEARLANFLVCGWRQQTGLFFSS